MTKPTRPLPELIVFDFDGVILDSAGIKTDGFAELFADRPDHVEAIVALHLKYGGYSRYRKFDLIYRDILDEPLDDDTRQRLGARYSEICLHAVLQAPPIPGAVEFLEEHSASVPCWVASGSPHEELVLTVERRGLAPHFAGVRGSPTTKPETVAEALRTHAATPAHTVLVGDAWSDLEAAQETGVAFVGVVSEDATNPFPPGITVIPDLQDLIRALR